MQGLTKRQIEIVEFIETYISQKRHSPSYREIQDHFGFASLGSVYNHVQSLKRRGVLPENTSSARSLSVQMTQKSEGIEVPLIGMIKGGMPIETYSQVASLTLPTHMASENSAYYLLRVIGSELEEEWIKEGDLLLIQSKTECEDQEMVLAQVGGQTTLVKRVIFDSPYIRLESENPEVQPMILREDHLQILGVIRSLIRDYSFSS